MKKYLFVVMCVLGSSAMAGPTDLYPAGCNCGKGKVKDKPKGTETSAETVPGASKDKLRDYCGDCDRDRGGN